MSLTPYSMTPYVTIYNEAGDSRRIYRASLHEWLATGEWSTEAPNSPKKPESVVKAELPKASRAADRKAPVEAPGRELTAEAPAAPVETTEVEAPAEEAPKKPAPRRRSKTSDAE